MIWNIFSWGWPDILNLVIDCTALIHPVLNFLRISPKLGYLKSFILIIYNLIFADPPMGN